MHIESILALASARIRNTFPAFQGDIMRKISLPLLLFAFTLLAMPSSALVLAKDGRTGYVIVTPVKPVISELTAAKELRDHLLAMTGAAFKIIPEDRAGVRQNLILIGQTDMAKKLMPGTDWKALGSDGIILRTIGNKIILTGGRPRGGIYAVYTFLEDTLGVRWWSRNESYIPKKPVLVVNNLNIKYIPRILCREAHYYEPNNSGIYAARTKQTGHFHPVSAQYGGHYSILGWCHTFYQLIPPKDYFQQHPEWFSLINGKRSHDAAQLCLTNEDMRRELVRKALVWIRKNPSAGIISIAQNDCGGECQCEKCKAIQDREGSPSGPVISFVNKVAEDINKVYPNFLIETLAYQYTRKAPKFVKPGKNVLIRLCSIECDYGLPITDPTNKPFMDDLHAWSAISHNLYIWSYIARYRNFQYPNPTLPVYAPNIRAFESNKVIGVFMQGDSYNEAACFARLRSWVIAHLLWNPALDEDKLVKEFVDGYYGAAGPYILDYLKLLEQAYARKAAYNWMTPRDMLEAQGMFDKAEDAVKSDPKLADRVRRERMPLDYLWISDYELAKQYALENNLEFNAPKDIQALIGSFEKAAVKYNMGYFMEGGPIAPYLKKWRTRIDATGPAPVELGNIEGKKCIDIQESRFQLFGEGDWVTIVEDESASNKAAALMPGAGNGWAVQAAISAEMVGRQHCYASIKVDTIASTGAACQMGLYSEAKKWGVFDRVVAIEEVAGRGYVLIDLGTWDINPGGYFWCGPLGNANEVKSVSIDRIFLVRE